MNILLVEDDSDYAERILRPRLENGGSNTVVRAQPSNQAKEILAAQRIDYVILDLAIPIESVEGSPSVEHGQSLAVFIRHRYPGHPVLILTGQSSEASFQLLEDDDSFAYFWDGQRTDIVKKRKKSKLDEALALVKAASQHLREVDSVDADFGDPDARQLCLEEKRSLKLFGKCRGAAAIKVSTMRPGLSGSKIVRIELLNQQGHTTQRAVAKIGEYSKIVRERENYDAYVHNLPMGFCPARIDEYFVGCGKYNGVFYQLADNVDEDYFELLRRSDDDAVSVVESVRNNLRTWHEAVESQNTTVAEVRRSICSDDKLAGVAAHLTGINLEAVERQELNVNRSIQHGDLHGENILVSNAANAFLIDYGDIGIFPSNYDAVTLALSPYFHPSTRDHFPSNKELGSIWFDEERYIATTNMPQTSSQLRAWNREVCFTERQHFAVVYAYALKQLTYPGINKEFAIALIQSAVQRLLD